ncbi:MAG: hypothetical protein II171_05980 [Bacteroidales bacterium]|nr:hypothetical protein [Bacteroidales bacterium]
MADGFFSAAYVDLIHDTTYNYLDLPEEVSRDDTSLVNDELFSVGVEWK